MVVDHRIIAHILYLDYNSGSPLAFVDFLVDLYEIPKKFVTFGFGKSRRNSRKDKYAAFYAKNELAADALAAIRDIRVHRSFCYDDLKECVDTLESEDVMTYVRFLKLDISEQEIEERRAEQVVYLEKLCSVFGEITLDIEAAKKAGPDDPEDKLIVINWPE